MATIGAAALKYLSSLVYQPDADVVTGMIPFTGVYWMDEIPDHDLVHALPEEDCHQVHRVLGIRKLIWRRQKLSPETKDFWELVKNQVPNCPVFQRLKPSREVLRVDVCVEREFDAFEAAMEAEATANSEDEEKPKP